MEVQWIMRYIGFRRRYTHQGFIQALTESKLNLRETNIKHLKTSKKMFE